MLRLLFLMVCILSVFGNSIYASDGDQKVYLASEQVICTDHGIFVLLKSSEGYLEKVLISQINYDGNGLFVYANLLPTPEAAWCRNGHKACETCFRCAEPGCYYSGCRCKRR
jgi:hypothetical protein